MTTLRAAQIAERRTLATLVEHWDTTGRLRVGDWTMQWRGTRTAGLLLPQRWRLRRR